MATYTEIEGQGKLTTANITGATTITITTPPALIGAAYFVLEAIRTSEGVYNSSSPSLAGSISGLAGGSYVQNNHVIGVAVPNAGVTFTYTPDSTISSGEAYVRGTGGITVEIS